MNVCDCYVVELIGEPYKLYDRWWQKVKYESWGSISEHTLMFSSRESAEKVQVGDHFLA